MTKTSKQITRLVISAALAMLLSLSLALPVFAGEADYPGYTIGTNADNPAKAVITKILEMPVGTVTPAATLDFVFVAVGMDEGNDPSGMPKIPNVPIVILAGGNPELETAADGVFVKDGEKSVVVESEYILKGLGSSFWNKGEGVYKYTLEEVQSGISVNLSNVNEGASYSKAVYDVEFWVAKDSQGRLYVQYINVKTKLESPDKYYEDEKKVVKVDPTPGGPKDKDGITIDDDFSQLIFTNGFWSNNGGDGTNPAKGALEVQKLITGNGAEKAKYFEFNVKAEVPSVVAENKVPEYYKAYILNAAGSKVVDAKNGAFKEGEDFLRIVPGVPFTFNLNDGQRLVFVDLHVGAAVAVKEIAKDSEYQPSYERTFSVAGNFIGEAGEDWGFPRSGDQGPHYTKNGDNANKAEFTNLRVGATPTGLDVNDLPFFVLIGAALAGLAGFVAVKSRRKAGARG